ncbi:MAG: hypothetical protein ABS76_23450 [Pelagibacterium sp. SCN 64-44]|nr:MAG: hypothetical protein ABS76_23450 [Pelagibacterium sp. SCN 64-44]
MLAALAASLSTPALATQGLSCSAPDSGAEISLLLGTAGGLGFAGASMSAGDRSWVTDPAYGEGETFTFGQGMSDPDGIRIDFFDEIVNDRVAELRLSRAEEGDDAVLAGTLRILGVGAWAVACAEQ